MYVCMDYGHVFRDTWKVRYMDGKIHGRLQVRVRRDFCCCLLLFYVVRTGQNKTEKNRTKQNDNG